MRQLEKELRATNAALKLEAERRDKREREEKVFQRLGELEGQQWEDYDKLEQTNAELLEALKELVVLMDAIREGEYTPDSFTTQPAREAIRKATT